jgi:hypothetical protein
MINNRKFKHFFFLSLAFLFISMGCSKEAQSTEESGVTAKTAVEEGVDKAQAEPASNDSTTAVPADFRTFYTQGMQFWREKNYASARENLLLAVAVNDQEELVVKFTKRHSSYLPHFYLGQIAFLTGDCKEAIAQWDISLSQDVIQTTPSYALLQKNKKECES